ncbi:hypothetical protein BJV78DRAFT_1228736 [Lactifluus subvellereus]|nr:hypothetical protein BJV78DRAFT_1228736 [Lactifluus subvellereus]
MEFRAIRVFVDVGRIHLRIYREAPGPSRTHGPKVEAASVPEMVPASLGQIAPIVGSLNGRAKSGVRGHGGRVRQ